MGFSEKTIEHEKFGRIHIVKSTRARRISISMRPFEPLRLTIPMLVPFYKAEEFLLQKEKWILNNLEKIQGLEDQYTVFTEETEFHTLEHELEIERIDNVDAGVNLMNRKIHVHLPAKKDIRDPEIQEMIRWGIQAAWRKEAKRHLPQKLSELSRKYNLPFNKVVIKNNKSRWGSCSSKNNINLSLHLMRLPDHLIDYILIHELVHTVHRNHSKKFWKDLEKYYPDAKKADRELKDFRIDIY
jgi:predicted metal-dependent hydrolase